MSAPAAAASSKRASIAESWLQQFVRIAPADKSQLTEYSRLFRQTIASIFKQKGIEVSCSDGGSLHKHTLVQSDTPDTDTIVKFNISFSLEGDVAEWSTAKPYTLSIPKGEHPGWFKSTSSGLKDIGGPANTNAYNRLVPWYLANELRTVLEEMLRQLKVDGASVVSVHKRCVRFEWNEMSFDFVPALGVSSLISKRTVEGTILVPFSLDSSNPLNGESVNWRLNFPAFNLKSMHYLTHTYSPSILHVMQLLKFLNSRHGWGITSYAIECLVVMKEAAKPWAFSHHFGDAVHTFGHRKSPGGSFDDQFWFVFRLLETAVASGKLPHQHAENDNFAPQHYAAIANNLTAFREGAEKRATSAEMIAYFKTPSKASSVNAGPATLVNVGCDFCHVRPIMGRRFQCSQCPNFDACEACFNTTSGEHDLSTHVERSDWIETQYWGSKSAS